MWNCQKAYTSDTIKEQTKKQEQNNEKFRNEDQQLFQGTPEKH